MLPSEDFFENLKLHGLLSLLFSFLQRAAEQQNKHNDELDRKMRTEMRSGEGKDSKTQLSLRTHRLKKNHQLSSQGGFTIYDLRHHRTVH